MSPKNADTVPNNVCLLLTVDRVEVLFDSASYHPFTIFFPPSRGRGYGRRLLKRHKRLVRGTPERRVPRPFPVWRDLLCLVASGCFIFSVFCNVFSRSITKYPVSV